MVQSMTSHIILMNIPSIITMEMRHHHHVVYKNVFFFGFYIFCFSAHGVPPLFVCTQLDTSVCSYKCCVLESVHAESRVQFGWCLLPGPMYFFPPLSSNFVQSRTRGTATRFGPTNAICITRSHPRLVLNIHETKLYRSVGIWS